MYILFVWFYLNIITTTATATPNNNRQDFTKVWIPPIPSSPSKSFTGTTTNSEYVEAENLIQEKWHLANSYLYGSSDISFIPDPYLASPSPNGTTPSSSSTVMSVKYGEGSYSPKGSMSAGRLGGAEFYAKPFGNHSFARAMLTYDVAFDSNFDWMRGGKLPGLFGGTPNVGCSGSHQADGQNCFSVRLMWRENGLGEAYLYVPQDDVLCKETLGAVCNKDYGVSFFRGRIKYVKEQWTRIGIYMQINDPPTQRNGILQIWEDNELVMDITELQYRTTNAVAISSLMFSTFFGGGSSDYATPHDTCAYFKNIRFSVAEPVHLSPPTPVSSAVTIARSMNNPILCAMMMSLLYVFVINI